MKPSQAMDENSSNFAGVEERNDATNVNASDHRCWHKYPKISLCCWCALGLVLFLVAVQSAFLPRLLDRVVDNGIESALIFTSEQPDSETYQAWLTNTFGKTAVPIWMECRFFNVTNADELLLPPKDGGSNWSYPQLHLTDPLVYDEWYLKYNVNFSFDTSKEWVEYQQWKYYTPRATQMYPKQLDREAHIVIISPIIAAIYYEWLYPKRDSIFTRLSVDEITKLLNNLDPEILFWKGTAEEILFNITQVNVTVLGHTLLKLQLDTGLLGNGSAPNSTSNGSTYEVTHTGHNAPHRMGEVLYYGAPGKGWIDCYDPPMQISPAKDTFFGIDSVREHDTQTLFVDDVYKNIALDYNYTYKWKDNIELYRYTVQFAPQYDNASMWPPNAQYAMFGVSGVQNLTACKGLPIFVSFPEFLAAPDFAVNNSKMGLDPNPPWTNLPFVDVEPRTGAIYVANKSLQLNTFIHSLPFNGRYENISQINADRMKENMLEFGDKSLHWIADDLMVPMVELSECEELPSNQAKKFSSDVVDTTQWAHRLEWIGVISGCLFAAWCTVCGYQVAKRKQQQPRQQQQRYHRVH